MHNHLPDTLRERLYVILLPIAEDISGEWGEGEKGDEAFKDSGMDKILDQILKAVEKESPSQLPDQQ